MLCCLQIELFSVLVLSVLNGWLVVLGLSYQGSRCHSPLSPNVKMYLFGPKNINLAKSSGEKEE